MRRIVVGNVEYKWTVGSMYLTVRKDGHLFLRVQAHEARGVTPDTWDRGRWKRTLDGVVTPRHVRAEIESRLRQTPMTHTTRIESTCAPQPYRQVHRWVCSCGETGQWDHNRGRVSGNAKQHERNAK